MLFSTARSLRSAVIVLGVATLAASAQAVPPTKSEGKAATTGYAQAVTQADGITNRITDKLISASDHYFHDGDYNRVIGILRVVVEADPDYTDGYENMAYLLWSQGYIPAADAILQQGLARTTEKGELAFEFGRHLYTTKRYPQAETYLAQSIRYPRPQPMYYATLGHCYEKNGKLTEAVQTWRTLVEKFPAFESGPPNLRRVIALQNKK